jgi:hypothetical protein
MKTTVLINSWEVELNIAEPTYEKHNGLYGYFLLCSEGGKLYFFYSQDNDGYSEDIGFEEIQYQLKPDECDNDLDEPKGFYGMCELWYD